MISWSTNPTTVQSNNSGAASKKSQYQSLLDANPYRNVTYQKSPWQNFLSALGFRTQADAWQENMNVQAREYDAAILQKEYDEQYNDPQSQVERMKAAGLNPDIDGGSSIDPGSAAPLGEDPSTPMQTSADELPIAFANQVMQAFSSAVGMIGTFQGLQRNHLENSLLGLQTERAQSDFFGSLSGMLLPPTDHPDGVKNFDWKVAALKNASAFSKNLPRKMQNKFIDFQERFFNSALGEGESYEQFKKRVQSKRGNALEGLTFFTEVDDLLLDVVEPLASANEKITTQQKKRLLKEEEAGTKSAENELAYQNAVDENGIPAARAGTELAQLGADLATAGKTQTEMETIDTLNETIAEIIDRLDHRAHEGGIKGGLASIALVLLSGVRLWLANVGAPSVSSSRSSWSNKSGSSSSFSLGF